MSFDVDDNTGLITGTPFVGGVPGCVVIAPGATQLELLPFWTGQNGVGKKIWLCVNDNNPALLEQNPLPYPARSCVNDIFLWDHTASYVPVTVDLSQFSNAHEGRELIFRYNLWYSPPGSYTEVEDRIFSYYSGRSENRLRNTWHHTDTWEDPTQRSQHSAGIVRWIIQPTYNRLWVENWGVKNEWGQPEDVYTDDGISIVGGAQVQTGAPNPIIPVGIPRHYDVLQKLFPDRRG
jgi:hypothetical protein